VRFSQAFAALTLLLVTSLPNHRVAAGQVDYAWEMLCGGIVKPVRKKLKFSRDGRTAANNDSIQRCTKHVYEFNGRAEQRVSATLSGNDRTSMFLLRKDKRVFYLRREWDGVLPANGKYALTVVTEEKNASYELGLKIE